MHPRHERIHQLEAHLAELDAQRVALRDERAQLAWYDVGDLVQLRYAGDRTPRVPTGTFGMITQEGSNANWEVRFPQGCFWVPQECLTLIEGVSERLARYQ